MQAAVERNVRAVVIKSHLFPTQDRATLVNKICKEHYGEDVGFEMFGGITLNRSVGGLNPTAVEAALKLGSKIVWLPTNSAENHRAKTGKSNGEPVSVVRDGNTVPELSTIFELVRDYDAVLASGHISAEECFIVAKAARKAGLEKLVVTHPEFWVVGMSLKQMTQIVKDYGVLLECVYAQPIGGGNYKKNLADNLAAMRAIGCEHFIVSTDSGQMQNPPWFESIAEYIGFLHKSGLTREQLDVMTKTNPKRMLGIK